ncbi:MAG: hypothetical protein ACE5DX_05195 [Candidatus Dojkabacteria bacterium]
MMTALFLVRTEAATMSSMSATLTRIQASTSTSVDLYLDLGTGDIVNGDEILVIDFDEDGGGTGGWAVDAASSLAADFDVYVDKSATPTLQTITEVTTDGLLDCALEVAADNQIQIDVNDTTGYVQVMFCAGTAANWTNSDAAGTIRFVYGSAAGGTNRVTNPTAGQYEIQLSHNSGESTGEIEVPVVDDDTVNVTGFIDAFVTFDIDTSEVDEDCDVAGGVTPCDSHGGATDNTGYVVDLGEMNTSAVNDSGDTVIHADGVSGAVNYIWFDTSTNANGGVAVTVLSNTGSYSGNTALSALEGPGVNEIESVAAEAVISTGGGKYGLAFATDDTGTNTVVSGSAATISTAYDQNAAATFGVVPASAGGTAATILSSSGALDQSRVQFEVGASPDAGNGTGTYTDEMTFIATATF